MVDWRWGEKYFATQLTDYDPAQNNGGWQWSSGSGADSQPYFRILSPISQSQRFDPDCEYIKKWIPSLKNIPNKEIIILSDAYKEIFKNENLTENLNNLSKELRQHELVSEVVGFIEKDKKRPICTPFSK